MRKLFLALSIALITAGCGVLYRQPIYQGNLLEKANVDQRWDYTASERTDRVGKTEIKNLTLYFEGDALARWEGEYFPEQDSELAKKSYRMYGPNLAKDKKKGRR